MCCVLWSSGQSLADRYWTRAHTLWPENSKRGVSEDGLKCFLGMSVTNIESWVCFVNCSLVWWNWFQFWWPVQATAAGSGAPRQGTGSTSRRRRLEYGWGCSAADTVNSNSDTLWTPMVHSLVSEKNSTAFTNVTSADFTSVGGAEVLFRKVYY